MKNININLILALSNLTVLPSLIVLYYQSRWVDLFFFARASLASFVYHLVEQKHDLPGYIKIDRWRWFLNIDRVAAWSILIYILIYYYQFVFDNYILVIITLIFNPLSEWCGIHCSNKNWFCLTHLIWHLLAYLIVFYISLLS